MPEDLRKATVDALVASGITTAVGVSIAGPGFYNVKLDPAFAATARGAALVARIKTEPLLNGCEVTTLVGENGEQPFVATSTEGLDGKSAVLWQPLDTCGTRRSRRRAAPSSCAG